MKTTTSEILVGVASAVLFLITGSASASASSSSDHCCQLPSFGGSPSCFQAQGRGDGDSDDGDEHHHRGRRHHDNQCGDQGGQLTSGTCNQDTGLCGGTDVCCSESEGPCSEVTADQCADTGGSSVLGEMCDAVGKCRNCLPEGSECPASGPLLGNFDTGACCSGKGACTLLGIVPVDCALAIVDVPPVFTCNCTAVPPYYDGASLFEPPSNMFAALYGAGAAGLLLPVRRRRRGRK